MRTWLDLAADRSVVCRALRVTAVVGAGLIAINHGDALLAGDISAGRLVRILLTVAVPYCVATYSCVAALRTERRRNVRDETVLN